MNTDTRRLPAVPPLEDDFGEADADAQLNQALPVSHAKSSEAVPKTKPASFRLSLEAHMLLTSRARDANLSTRAWLEQAILENRTQIVAKAKPHPELKPLLFIAGKAGNNLNQVAHHFNSQRMQGKITAETCATALEVLTSIEALFLEAVANARPH